ncbi:hypothetical protein ACS8FD_09260 [Psychrobacter sp. 1U2]|uniref:hypothetical protein n=1 Tax=Psychrobacter sp. 1U2 TaxID=3453577 RepID=UPI003F44F7E8
MKYSDIFIKSDLGRQEIKSHALGILPREARTLLIMVDGKRSYQSYLDTLDNGKMFVEFGGVTPLFELLLEFGCIEIIGQQRTDIDQAADTQTQPVPVANPEPVKETSAAEFDRTFNNPEMSAVSTSSSSLNKDASYEATKSELAAHIEQNALPEEAWGYLLSLEQCNAPSELLVLIQQMQSSSNRQLTNKMADFAQKIKPYT